MKLWLFSFEREKESIDNTNNVKAPYPLDLRQNNFRDKQPDLLKKIINR